MSTSVLKALPGKLDIKRHSPSILYVLLPYCVIFLEIHLLTRILTALIPRGITYGQRSIGVPILKDNALEMLSIVLTYKLFVLTTQS